LALILEWAVREMDLDDLMAIYLSSSPRTLATTR
jgi:hypothetical protein